MHTEIIIAKAIDTTKSNHKILAPKGAKILGVEANGNGDGGLLWLLVTKGEEREEDIFLETFTVLQDITWDMGTDRKYIGRILLEGGTFHVFEYTGV